MEKNFFYYLLPSLITGILSILVMVPIVTYYLDPKDFGIFAILSAITMPIGPLSSTGAPWVLAGNYYKIDADERKTLVFNLLILDFVLKLFWVLLFWFTASWLLPIIIKDFKAQYIYYFKILLISLIFSAFWSSVSNFIILQKKGLVHAVFEILQWLAGAIATLVCLIVLKLSTATLFIAPLTSAFFIFIVCILYVRNYTIPKIDRHWLSEIFKVGLPAIPSSLFEMVNNIVDRFFINRWVGLSMLGIYSHSLSYRENFIMALRAFNRTISPYTLEAYSNNLDLSTLKTKLQKWYGLSGIAGLFVVFFSYEVIKILTHGKFVGAAPLVPIWFLTILFFTYGLPYLHYLLVHKKNRAIVYIQISASVLFVGITTAAIYKFGIFGATIAMVLLTFAIQSAFVVYAKRLGCAKIGEEDFLLILLVLVGAYFFNWIFCINIFIKVIALILLCLFLLYRFRPLEIPVRLKGRSPLIF